MSSTSQQTSQTQLPPQSIKFLDQAQRTSNDWYRFLQDIYQFSGLAKRNFPLREDLVVSGDQMLYEGADGPTLTTLTGGLRLYAFSPAVMQSLRFQLQIPHGWINSDVFYPFVQWAPTSGAAGDVRWGLEYSWSSIGSSFPPSITRLSTGASPAAALRHTYTEFTAIDGPGQTFSSQLVCRIFRDGAASDDTYPDPVFLLSSGGHYNNTAHGTVRVWP